jgi:serine/threonine protein kinase
VDIGPVEGELIAGRYRLGPVVGLGSSAVVRRGRDERTGRPVAVKIVHGPDRQRVRDEADALGRLRHRAVIGLRHSGEHDGRPVLVTDLVDGPTLAEEIGRGPLAPERVRRLGVELAGALAHIHASGLVHRDLKPANVLIGDDGRPRLADFGIAKAADTAASTETLPGTIVGTAAFLAPEQAQGLRVGPPADVYALGLVLLEALTGRREFPGTATESALARLHRDPVVPDGLPGELGSVLRAMTAAAPVERPTATEVCARLLPSRPGARHRRSRGRHRAPGPIAAVAAGLVAGGAAAAMVLVGPPSPPVGGAPAAIVR